MWRACGETIEVGHLRHHPVTRFVRFGPVAERLRQSLVERFTDNRHGANPSELGQETFFESSQLDIILL